MPNTSVEVVDCGGTMHVFDQSGVKFHTSAAECRVYNQTYGTLASFWNYASARYINPTPRDNSAR